MIPSRKYSPSPDVMKLAQSVLGERFGDSRRIAESVLRLSDHFIENPEAVTPWEETWAKDAYFGYYLPLNEIRNRAVVDEGLKLGFFEGLSRVVDFGAGPGTADFALSAVPSLKHFALVERSEIPARLSSQDNWKFHFKISSELFSSPRNTLFVASYSLTETEIPLQALTCEALMILEPSTQADGRKLLDLRARLLNEGYYLWAPCTHQLECPLRKESVRDWCHDRVHVDRPEWLTSIEEHLPFRNQTITFSYLLARRTPPPSPPIGAGRLVGDRLKEKGKDRQMVCRTDQREFLAWLHRHGEQPELPRGIRVVIPPETAKTSNEIRLTGVPEILP